MRSFRILSGALGAALLAMTLTGCGNENEPNLPDTPENDTQMHTCVMNLNVERPSFEGETRSSEGWENGDKVYIIFGENEAYGTAQYNNGVWTISYNATMEETTSRPCKVIYCEDSEYTTSSSVVLNSNSGIFEGTGVYSYADDTMNVNATLSPKTGRIRFAGKEGTLITVVGLSYNTTYDIPTGKFYTTSTGIKTTVGSDGYTPYIYSTFATPDNPYLTIITTDNAFSRRPGKSVLGVGESGYMDIPSTESYIGWENEALINVNGAEFFMIPVEYEKGNFMLARTETTITQYNAVSGSSSTSDSNLPKASVDGGTWRTWVDNLNDLTGLQFYVPTSQEWQFAYMGGNKSKGYTYSGSNIPGDVAWYSVNSGSTAHEVSQKQPNELGFYDMAGNVFEYANSGSSYYDYFYGGGYSSSSSSITATSSISSYSYNYSGGFRVALRFTSIPQQEEEF